MTKTPQEDSDKLAVALKYDREKDPAPRVTAKGRGETAERIIALAREHDVVVEGNPALAHALSEVELDETIPETLYGAVAAVIGFVMREVERKRKSPFRSDGANKPD
ncbi:EscU/YscU/HrcU family type III secretion system export apparatus switch protein [uncultured Cohaesibacter sp.]|uniref:EscU/YscU/HrcU family type III secretion system export apparatus switch protein n=1 Tax=uncultured Cohaesibacter sp. TaxID=1002546 RepID=UPI0029C86B41|nr:EscU/YscU/HrcU family type III secretion system export apparatus switch protein [uncultured Cohaesibacter sp.]